MIKKITIPALYGAALGIFLASCTMQAQNNYSITFPAPAGSEGSMAYLMNADSGTKVDSTLVTSDTIRFAGSVSDPYFGRIYIGADRGPILMVEKGNIVLDNEGTASGTPLNDRQKEFVAKFKSIIAELRQLDRNDSIQALRIDELSAQVEALPMTIYRENSNNPLGTYWFLQEAYEMPLNAIKEEVEKNPYLGSSASVQSIIAAAEKRLLTGPGSKYIDFSVPYEGKLQKLSDYVKPGRYTLVDYWASWCGPCIRQSKVLKELYSRFHDRGLDVVGVAVWDDPQATLSAIESHGLPWPNIIDAQTLPTDLYGISGIPCIMLIDPDGVIVSRDKQGQDLIDDVEKAMENFTPALPEVPTAATDTTAIF